MLTKIEEKDLIFTNEIEDDRTNTFLTLNDYDWMDYQLKTRFKTENLGILDVIFNYFGLTTSEMIVKQRIDDKEREYLFKYDTEIFKKYLIKFLKLHIESWNSTFAFYGGDIVLEFYNEVIESGELK